MSKPAKRGLSRRDFLRTLSASAGTVMMASLVSACSTATAPTSAVSAGNAAPTQSTTTLRLWTMNDPAWIKASEDMIKKWKNANPNIEIKYENFPYDEFIQTIQTSMAAKNEADVIEMFGSWVQSYAKGRTISVMPDDIISVPDARKKFYAAPLDGYTFEDKLYGLPHEFNIENGGVLVNQRMFTDASLSYPPAWQSWDQLIEDGKKLTKMKDNAMTVSGFDFINSDGLAFLLWEGILERGADYFAQDKTHLNLLTPEAEQTVQWMVDLVQKDHVVDPLTFNPTVSDVQDAFFQGLVAIGFRGPWVVPVARIQYPDFADKWNYVSCPHFGDKMSFAADSGWGLVVSPNSQNMSEAWQWVQFSTLDSANARMWNVNTGTVPALISLAEDPSILTDLDWIGPSLQVLPYGRYVGNLQDRDFIWYNVVETHILEALQGKITVQQALTKMNDESNATIDKKLA